MKNTKVIFMGTPDFAVPILEVLLENTNVIMVVTQPDKEIGRHHELVPTPIKKVAQEHNIPVFQPIKIREEYDRIIAAEADIIITCAYGQIIPEAILNAPRLGCINVHASLLPRLRGGAPLHHALIDGETETGVTIMYMDKKMDTGDIISTIPYHIKETDNVGTLHDTLSQLGKNLLLETLPSIIAGTNQRIPQDNTKATYAWNISREEEHLDFNKTAREIYNKVRGLYPWPKANALINGVEVKILECFIGEKDSHLSSGTICEINKDNFGICTKDKVIYITKVKPFGKKEMSARDFLNGINKEKLLHTIVE
ncbi:MAG TPA: methionyl-tRNA formyltransferase [Candidatus Coprovivens excrementavium]|nr:methionyl-tRNA formyltransferase [Candidatus Coprovivens excrementavium]